MKRSGNIINLYLIRLFLRNLALIFISIAILSFIINLFDILNLSNSQNDVTFIQIIILTLLKIPEFMADIAVFLIMLCSMITLNSLNARSEITIMRSVGLSMWKILMPIIITNFILGIIFITSFLPLTIIANKKYNEIEDEITGNDQHNIFKPDNGIWLRQENLINKNEEIKIRAEQLYKNNLNFKGVTVWFFDKNNKFYKKLDAKNMILKNNYWHIESAILNDKENINKEVNQISIKTNLEENFVNQKVVNNFKNVKLFSIFDLPELISNLESAGFSPRKFKVYFHSLLNYPLLFVSISLIAAYFSINNIRNRNNVLYIVCGIIFGLINYVGLHIMSALGSAGIIPYFMATWLVALLFLAISVILVFQKE